MSDDPELQSSPLADPILGLRASLQAIHQAGQEAFLKELQEQGGALRWCQSRLPRVTSLVSSTTDSSVMESVIQSETQAFWIGLEARLAECARCPPEGAACEASSERIEPGKLVQLEISGAHARAREAPCERYSDFRMSRKLEAAGVDKRLSRVKLLHLCADLPRGAPPPHVVVAFDQVVAAGVGKGAPVGIELLIEGDRAREYGVALLRSISKNYPNASSRSVHVGALIREEKQALTLGSPSPLAPLTEPAVLVLDAVDGAFLRESNKWGKSELFWLYDRRRDQRLTTIITSSVPAKEAFPGVRVLKV